MNLEYKKKCKIAYIKKYQYGSSIKDWAVKIFREVFNVIKIEECVQNLIITIPFEIKKNKIKNKKLEKILEDNKIDGIAIEKELKNEKIFFYKYKCLNGKFIFKNLVIKVLEYILKISNKNSETEEIHILENEYNEFNIQLIKDLAIKFKIVNIITNKFNLYKKLEEELYKKNGIMITISNNYRKSLRKAKYIINFDFDNEELKKYAINRNAILINLTNEEMKFKNSYSGIVVNNVEFDGKFEKNIKYEKEILYESYVFNQTYKFVQNQILKDGIKINKLIGIRGKIDNSELIKINNNT